MTPEDDTWAQTVITVTPEEDATIREIASTAILSSEPSTPLVLDADKIVYRKSFTHRQFVEQEDGQMGEVFKQDAENQTYLQGTPIVHISAEYKDHASQTMYMSSPCPPLIYFKDIMTSMNEAPVPTLKTSDAAATILSFHPKTPQHVVIEQLSTDVTEQELEEFASNLTTDMQREMEVTEILYFLMARVFWIIDPTSQAREETVDEATQTSIKYNNHTKTFVVDVRIQTELTCEPKKSNTKLLADYWETKDMVLKCLDDCFSKGIENRIVVDDLILEIIDKCADRIRYPMRDQTMQTIATYKLHGEKEEDVLRKLRLEVIIDPLESSIVVLPLMDDLLRVVCDTVSKNASKSVKNVLEVTFQRTMMIVIKRMELQKETKPKPMEQILAQRRKKILESMLRKETETISTQTSIAGIVEVKRMKESKDVVCSVCRQQSMCQYCTGNWENGDAPQPEFKPLRTQDILLAYQPCYVVTTAAEKEKSVRLPYQPERKLPATAPTHIIDDSTEKSSDTISVLLQPEKKIQAKESFNEWSYVIDATLMKSCSMKGPMSDISQATVTSSGKSTSKSFSQDPSCLHSNLASDAANALQILKETFCNQENCTAFTLQASKENSSFHAGSSEYVKSMCDTCLSRSSISDKTFEGVDNFCTQQTCKAFSKLHLPKTSPYSKNSCSQVPVKSRGDGFKIIPICLSQNSDL